MDSTRSGLPVPGSRVPKNATPTSIPNTKIPDLSERTVKTLTVLDQSESTRKRRSKLRGPNIISYRPAPTIGSKTPGIDCRSPAAQPSKVVNRGAEVGSESMSSSRAKPGSGSDSSSKNTKTTVPISSSKQASLYNGPHLVEPCVGNALLHVLQPCGHRVLTRCIQLCGSNCKGSDTAFANARSEAKFNCAVCISIYVHEHLSAKRSMFIPSLVVLENALGGFPPGWKAERIARMERIWRNDAVEEQSALEKLGRHCDAIQVDPEEEAYVDDEELAPAKQPSPQVQLSQPFSAEMKTDRLPVPVSRASRKSQLPSPSSPMALEKNAVESERMKRTSRIPMGPKLSLE